MKYCWIARTKQSVITLAALITPSSRLERKKYDVERYQASNRTARYGNSADVLPSDYRRRSFGYGRTGLFSAVFLVVEASLALIHGLWKRCSWQWRSRSLWALRCCGAPNRSRSKCVNDSDRSHMRLLDLSVTVCGACWCSPPPSIPCLPW